MKSSISRAPITASTGLSDSAQIVRGASNLTTVGAVPYVSASGVLNQDASNFFWDATNHRLGIGTNAPDAPFSVLSSNITNGGISISHNNAGAKKWWLQSGITSVSDSAFQIRNNTNSITRMVIDTNGFGIGPSNTSPTGTLHVYDATASTGATTLTVKAGAGQSSTNLQEWQNSSGTVLANVASSGIFAFGGVTASFPGIGRLGSTANFAALLADGSAFTNMGGQSFSSLNGFTAGSGAVVGFTSAASVPIQAGTSPDASISRVSAGVVGVGTGAAGSVAGSVSASSYGTAGGTGAALGMSFSGSTLRLNSGAAGALVELRDQNGVYLSVGAGPLVGFGGTTSSFPALKRSTTGIVARLADDSADTWIKVKSVITSALTVATLPASPTAGERAFVTDSNAVSFTAGIGAVVASGGSTAVPVVYDGTSWRIG